MTMPTASNGNVAATATPARSLSILIVENHLETRHSVAILLRVFGHRPEGAESMAAALALAGRTRFDVLLSDLRLPDGDGCDLLRQLAALGCRPAQAVAMSGLGEPSDHARSRDAGFETLLVKPFAPESLEEALRRAIPPSPSGGSTNETAATGMTPTAAHWARRLHDGLCQQLAAAALWQGILIRRLEMTVQATQVTALAVEDGDVPGSASFGALEGALTEAEQVGRMLDEALHEARALMRDIREGETTPPAV